MKRQQPIGVITEMLHTIIFLSDITSQLDSCVYIINVLKLIRIALYKVIKTSLLFYELAKWTDEILISYLCMRP